MAIKKIKKKVLIFGSSGMLGHTLFHELSKSPFLDVHGTIRGQGKSKNVLEKIDAYDFNSIKNAFEKIKPDIVINCIGLIKQLPESNDPEKAIYMNSLFPHRLAKVCKDFNSRMIHFSTDCVFSGKKGNYKEGDFSDADDLYGKTKFLGEVNYPNTITMRTSIIGHEINTKFGLVEWFLSQEDSVKGYKKAIFSGFPTIEIARIIDKYIIPNASLTGLYHVSAEPISKHDLLKLISDIYKKKVKIVSDSDIICDRSLDSSKFREETGYLPPSWDNLIKNMFLSYKDFKI